MCLDKSCTDSHESRIYEGGGIRMPQWCLWRTEGRFRKLVLSSAMWAPEIKLRSLSALLRWLHLLTQIVIEIFINLGNVCISVLNVIKCNSNLGINDIRYLVAKRGALVSFSQFVINLEISRKRQFKSRNLPS